MVMEAIWQKVKGPMTEKDWYDQRIKGEIPRTRTRTRKTVPTVPTVPTPRGFSPQKKRAESEVAAEIGGSLAMKLDFDFDANGE
jgi:hypothetical protein